MNAGSPGHNGSPATAAGPTIRTVVIDYGAGNLHSMTRALQRAGLEPRVADRPEEATKSDLLVLPGQGRFGQVARAFKTSGFEPLVRAHIAAGRPFLGVCVGLQILLESSEEDPDVPGLGIVPGRVRRFQGGVRVPQMGWNSIRKFGESKLFSGVPDGSHVYFANSYYAEPAPDSGVTAGATSRYGATEFNSAFSIQNLHATQFHPEKSQAVGLRMLANLKATVAELVA